MAAIPRVGELLVESGVITREQLSEALSHQACAGGRVGTNLVELGHIDEKTLAAFLAKQLSLPSVTAAQLDRVQPEVLQLLTAQLAERYKVVPIREDAGRLWVAMADPTDKIALEELERHTRRTIRAMVAPELLIQYALEKHYKVQRRPRVVEVRTSGSDLLQIEHGDSGPRAAPVPREPPPSEAPPYRPFGDEISGVDLLTGYIDESPAVAAPAPRPARLGLEQLVELLVNATTDEAVLEAAVRFLAQDVARVWVFLLRGGALTSWGGRGLDQAGLKTLRVPLAELPLVAQALSTGEVLAGRLQPGALGQLAAPLRVVGETLGLILPVRIGKHAVGVIFGLEASLDAMRRKAEHDKLAQKLDQALHINYLRRLLLQV